MSSPVATYDFTFYGPPGAGLPEVEDFIQNLQPLFKKWTFQKEQCPTTDKLHFQGRGSLIKKKRDGELKALLNQTPLKGMHVAPTVTANLGAAFYCMKYDSRVDGPWSDETYKPPPYIPRQYRGMLDQLYQYQQTILDSRNVFTSRGVNLVYDKRGNRGKSTVAALAELHYKAIDLPPISDHKELLQVVCDVLMGKKERDPQLVFVDLPRSLTEGSGLQRLASFMVAIEQIKKGHVCDVRHHYKDWWFDSPQIWVFCNHKVDVKYLSRDRWILHTINEYNNLVTLSHDHYDALD